MGHYAILGASQPAGLFGSGPRPGHAWHPSKGVIIQDYAVIGSHAVIDDGTSIGAHSWIGSGVRIGHDSEIGSDVQIYYRAQIYDRVIIGPRAWIGGFICNDSIVEAESIVLGSLIHRFVDAKVGIPEEAPLVKNRAFVGHGATVIGGVTVGSRSYIAAGAVLLTDAQAGRLYAGVPARDVGPAPDPLTRD
ncbi:DapH/DapD/GlmU-related protein [Streptomyces sp. NPDC058954]|uniref:DapH/DapD/GlmU-related protein n=1 Tax=Streptomyces sp. NPDC058954 TaxID=3346677 RepID=UPI00369EC0BE